MSAAMVTVTVSDRTELRTTDRGATAVLIGPDVDHVTLMFHGDRLAAIDRLQEALDKLRGEVAEGMHHHPGCNLVPGHAGTCARFPVEVAGESAPRVEGLTRPAEAVRS